MVYPRSGLALKKFIDVGAGVIDADYRGELGVILFNFASEEFTVNMGDKMATLIFEKIKTPEIKEVNELEETGRGSKGYGSTGLSADQLKLDQDIKTKISSSGQSSKADQSEQKKSMNEPVQIISQLSQTRQIISTRQI